MVDPSEELANDHADDTQSCCLALQISQLFEHGLQSGTIGEIESLSGKLIDSLAQGSASQSSIASASAVLQSADEMEMAELHDPTLVPAEPDNSRNLVGDRSPDATAYVNGDGGDRLRPAPQVLSSGQKQRIEKDGTILVARSNRHQIQDPILSSKAEVKSVQHQNQRPCCQVQPARSLHPSSQRSAKTPTQPLVSKAITWSDSFQCAPVQQHRFQNSSVHPPRLAASLLASNSPRSFAPTALTAARTTTINFRSATQRFRVRRMHARELATV